MSEHMLIEIARRQKRFVAQNTSGDVCLAVLETFVAHEFTCTTVLLTTIFTLKTFLMQHQMFVQSASVMKLLTAQVTRIFILDVAISLLMPPFVALDILDFLATKTTDLQFQHMDSLHMMRQVDLQFITATTIFANESRLVIAVDANVVPFQSVLTFVFHVTDLTLKEIVRLMYSFVRLQGC